MLEKPRLADSHIIARVQQEFQLPCAEITFLPLGADVNTAVYRLVSQTGSPFFLKLRKGPFDPASVLIPQLLKSQGIRAIISPLVTHSGQLWADLDDYRMILYPFIEGQDGYQLRLTDQQWIDFGSAMQKIHTAPLPAELAQLLPRETFSPRWRDVVRSFQAQIEHTRYADPVATRTAGFLRDKAAEITHMLNRTDQLGQALKKRRLKFFLCHSDIHAGNLHITPSGELFIVDWDAPILAPKERDLLLIGGCTTWNHPRDEELFYYGYRSRRTHLDRMALAYYRYQRVIEDIAAFCQQLLGSEEGGEDREQSYQWLVSNFLPEHEIDLARRTDSDEIE